MNKPNPKADEYLDNITKWKTESIMLRKILLSCGLEEELKWGKPCYALNGGNVAIVQGFKEYCAVLFVKGALLKDPEGILVQQTENVQAARQVRFTGIDEITRQETELKELIGEAVQTEKSGLKVPLKKTSEFKMPDEFRSRLNQDSRLKDAFEALTPGRQRAYILYFSSAKQSATREARIEKYTPEILDGIGLNEQ